MKKISFFIGEMQRGGAERVISILANHYSEMGWNVDIVLLLNNQVGYPLNQRISIVDLTAGGGSYGRRLPIWLVGIRSYFKKAKPDKVVSFIGRINILVLTSAIGRRIPIYVSERNDPRQDGRGAWTQRYCNFIYRKASAIIFQNEYEKSCFHRGLYKKSFIVPNPIEIHAQPRQQEGLELVTAGRLQPQKNQKMMIQAVALLRDKFPQIRLNIYGDGPLWDALEEEIQNLKLENQVKLRGNIPDLHEQIAGAFAFVQTSEFEGMSNVLLEAMMLGLPCIVTNYSGVEEVITHGYNGVIVPRGDVSKLADAIETLIHDTQLRQKIRSQGLDAANAYKTESVLALWDKTLQI